MRTKTKMKIKKILDHYGIDKQIDIAIEEMSELIKELCKYKRGGNNVESIKEELCDTLIMCYQIQYAFNFKEELDIENLMNKKLDRQLERIENEN